MTPEVRFSRGAAVRLAAALALVCLATIGRAVLVRSWRQQARTSQQEEAALVAEIASKQKFGRAQLQALQIRARQVRSAAADADSWQRLEGRLARWQPAVAEMSPSGSDGAALRRRTFVYPNAVVGDWPQILATIEGVESLSGLAIEAVELAIAPGTGEQRFALVRLRVVGRAPSPEINSTHHE